MDAHYSAGDHSWSDWVTHNIKLIVSLLVIILISVAFYNYRQGEKEKTRVYERDLVYSFQKTNFEKNLQSKQYSDIVSGFKKVTSDLGESSNSLVPISFDILDAFIENSRFEEGLQVVEMTQKVFEDAPSDAQTLYDVRKAVILENLDKIAPAAEALEGVLKRGAKTFEVKVYFDLARLYRKKGESEMAKKNYQHIIENYPNHSLTKLSKVLLQEL